MPHDERQSTTTVAPPRPRRRWPLLVGLGLVATLGMCVLLPSLLPVEGKRRSKAELEALVTENRAALDELVSLARKETKEVYVQSGDGSEGWKRYGRFLDRLGAPGPLHISLAPFQVRILLHRSSGRDREELVFGPEPLASDLVEDLDRAKDRSPDGGSVYMRLPGGWLAWQVWD